MSENVYNPEISHWYDAIMEAGYNPSDHKAAADAIVKILGSRKKVLELGIGTGLLAEQLADVGIELSGFDFSQDMLERAAVRLGDKVKLYRQDVLNLDLSETYEAAVSQGGVWVATKDGNCLDSHITGYERNLQGLRRVAKHLDDNGLLIINLGPEQRDLTMQLADGAEYSQKVKFVGDNFEKDYFVMKDGKVVAHQHVVYTRFNPEQTARIIDEAGFRKSGIDDSKSFVVYEKK
ncbi:MAG: class I SAM-dependent methyltransferase [Nanoarchaeota archaeon]|nr:class I SAM-dependent methyltransferase [Nanoarchaeota archaeon]